MAAPLAIAGALGPLVSGIMGGLDALFTSDEEREAAKLKILAELNKPHILQALANIEEAKHTNWFVAGWRPGIGWICALGLGYQFLILPFAELIAFFAGTPVDLPPLDGSMLMTMTMSLLGLGGLRTAEKFKGVARNQGNLGGLY